MNVVHGLVMPCHTLACAAIPLFSKLSVETLISPLHSSNHWLRKQRSEKHCSMAIGTRCTVTRTQKDFSLANARTESHIVESMLPERLKFAAVQLQGPRKHVASGAVSVSSDAPMAGCLNGTNVPDATSLPRREMPRANLNLRVLFAGNGSFTNVMSIATCRVSVAGSWLLLVLLLKQPMPLLIEKITSGDFLNQFQPITKTSAPFSRIWSRSICSFRHCFHSGRYILHSAANCLLFRHHLVFWPPCICFQRHYLGSDHRPFAFFPISSALFDFNVLLV